MALTSRRRRPLNRTVDHLRDTRLIIIATEGRITEAQYFRELFTDLRVQVYILSTDEDNRSAPQYVLDRLNDYAEQHQIGGDDELWLMVDKDRWPEKRLASVTREAKQRGYGLAISNPCFEIWLLCHLMDPSQHLINDCGGMEALLRQTLGGYNKTRINIENFRGNIQIAIHRARSQDPNPNSRWPHSIGTHVYRVISSILALNH